MCVHTRSISFGSLTNGAMAPAPRRALRDHAAAQARRRRRRDQRLRRRCARAAPTPSRAGTAPTLLGVVAMPYLRRPRAVIALRTLRGDPAPTPYGHRAYFVVTLPPTLRWRCVNYVLKFFLSVPVIYCSARTQPD
jgi:hypothetical protein